MAPKTSRNTDRREPPHPRNNPAKSTYRPKPTPKTSRPTPR